VCQSREMTIVRGAVSPDYIHFLCLPAPVVACQVGEDTESFKITEPTKP